MGKQQPMKILKTMVSDGTSIQSVDTIEFEGQMWLVPLWFDLQEEGMTMPLRIIALATIPHQVLEHYPAAQFAANKPLPKAFFEPGPIPPELKRGYEIRERPPIQIRGGYGVQ